MQSSVLSDWDYDKTKSGNDFRDWWGEKVGGILHRNYEWDK